MKTVIFLLMLLATCLDVLADEGIVWVKGAQEACIYNNIRGRGRACFRAEDYKNVKKIIIPEEQCADLLYLIVDGYSSWLRLQPGEEVTVKADKRPWKFSGDEKQVNDYLYGWTEKYWLGKPNMLTAKVQMMFRAIPDKKKKEYWLTADLLKSPEYMEWVENWEKNAISELQKAKLKDEQFVAEQCKRIHYNWLELQGENYQMFKGQIEIPESSLEFVRKEFFGDVDFLKYPGMNDVLKAYFDIADRIGLFDYSSTDFLKKRAEWIQSQEIREAYILDVLQGDFNYGYFYQGEAILQSVKDMIISETGRNIWDGCYRQYQNWLNDKKNPTGKGLVSFSFENIYGEKISPYDMFKGKYLLIDVWASWCAPCKAQMPYLKQLMKDFEGRDIAFLSVSADRPKDKETWKKMLKKFGMEDHGVISSDGFNHRLFEVYGIKSIPRFILVDPAGKVVDSKARRPSDPILKKQLEELLAAYDKEKVSICGFANLEDGSISLSKPGGMYQVLATAKITNHKFSFSASVREEGFYTLGYKDNFYSLWLAPGDCMEWNQNRVLTLSGDHAGINNMLVNLWNIYGKEFRILPNEDYNRARGRRLKSTYDKIIREIETSVLTSEEKDLVTGFWQGKLLQQMYAGIVAAKVYGKVFKRPNVCRGYSDAILDLELLPEFVYYPEWIDILQEFLYAQLEAGRIKIRNVDFWLADMAQAIRNEELRETYIMETLRLEILRNYLYRIEDRIEQVRPFIKSAKNLALLDEMLKQIANSRKMFTNAAPKTDLSHFVFENAEGKQIALSDFKGKYVFIDIWSTGCNPCIGEISYIRDMEKRFAGKPIVCVSISLDSKKKIWLDFLKENHLDGVQLICSDGFKHPFMKQIGLRGIPHFLLLDKEGKVIDAHTWRPSNPALSLWLENLLK